MSLLWDVAILLGAAGLGLGCIPITVYLFGPSLPIGVRKVIATILFAIAMLTFGRGALNKREDGHYEMFPVEERGGEYIMFVDGKEVELEGPAQHWSRLGFAPFCVTYEKSEDVFDGELVEDASAMADGGTARMRGDIPVENSAPDDDSVFHVLVERIIGPLRRAGGPQIADEAQAAAFAKYGGDTEMSDKLRIATFLVCLFGGALSGYWVWFA